MEQENKKIAPDVLNINREIALVVGCSERYVRMVTRGKRDASSAKANTINRLYRLYKTNFEAYRNQILSAVK